MEILQDVVARLEAIRSGAAATVERAKLQLADAQAELDAIDRMIEAGQPKPKRSQKRTRAVPDSGETLGMVRAVLADATWDAAVSDLPGSFTLGMVMSGLEAATPEPPVKSTVTRALEALRSSGEIRHAGQFSLGGKRPANVYVIERAEGIRGTA